MRRSGALLGLLVAASCEQVLGIPDRQEAANLECVDGACACVSEAFADCNDDLEDGCEVHLADNPTNCAVCGHDCLGGGCSEGLCTPSTLFQDGAFGIDRDGRTIFFGTAHGEVRTFDLDTGALGTLYTGPSGNGTKVVDVAADAHHVVAISQFGMAWIDRASPETPVVQPMALTLYDRVALTDSALLLLKRLNVDAEGAIWRYPFDGGAPTVVFSDKVTGSRPVATHASTPFWSTKTTVWTLDASGAPVHHLDGFTRITGLAESEEALFVLDDLANHCEVSIHPWDGSAPETLNIGGCPLQFAANARLPFWINDMKRLVMFQDGIVVLATGLADPVSVILAPTEDAVYLTGDLGLRRVAR